MWASVPDVPEPDGERKVGISERLDQVPTASEFKQPRAGGGSGGRVAPRKRGDSSS